MNEYYKSFKDHVTVRVDPVRFICHMMFDREATDLVYRCDVNVEEKHRCADALLRIMMDEINNLYSLQIEEV